MPGFGRLYKSIRPCEHTARVPPRPQLPHFKVGNDGNGVVVRFLSKVDACHQGWADRYLRCLGKGLRALASPKLASGLHALELKTNKTT